MTKVSPTAIIPVIDTWFRMLEKFAVVRKDGLATLKKMTRKSSVAKGAMLRSWFLNQRPNPPRFGTATVSETDIKSPLIPDRRRP